MEWDSQNGGRQGQRMDVDYQRAEIMYTTDPSEDLGLDPMELD